MSLSSKLLYFSLGSFVTVIAIYFGLSTFLYEPELQTVSPTLLPFQNMPEQIPPPFAVMTEAPVQAVDLSMYTIAYLADEATLMTDALFSAQNIFGQHVLTFTRMSDLEAYAAQNPLDVLVVHISAQAEVNPAWMTPYLAGSGVVFVTLDVPIALRRTWTNKDCVRPDSENVVRAHEQTGEHYAYTAYTLTQSESEINRAQAIEHELTTRCTNEPVIPPPQNSEPFPVYSGSGSSVTHLSSAQSILELRAAIHSDLWNITSSRTSFANRHLPPTAFPGMAEVPALQTPGA